jgi:hypothetical protein
VYLQYAEDCKNRHAFINIIRFNTDGLFWQWWMITLQQKHKSSVKWTPILEASNPPSQAATMFYMIQKTKLQSSVVSDTLKQKKTWLNNTPVCMWNKNYHWCAGITVLFELYKVKVRQRYLQFSGVAGQKAYQWCLSCPWHTWPLSCNCYKQTSFSNEAVYLHIFSWVLTNMPSSCIMPIFYAFLL